MKEYPLRWNEEAYSEMVDICECGHTEGHHEGFKYNNSKVCCGMCTCPKYKFEQKMTLRESIDLALHIFKKSYKNGNTQ